MKCLRCGHCCLTMLIPILVDPDRDDVITIDGSTRCPHLIGDTVGKYKCKIHSHPRYKETPCYQFDQIGQPDANCRLGEYFLKKKG